MRSFIVRVLAWDFFCSKLADDEVIIPDDMLDGTPDDITDVIADDMVDDIGVERAEDMSGGKGSLAGRSFLVGLNIGIVFCGCGDCWWALSPSFASTEWMMVLSLSSNCSALGVVLTLLFE